MSTTITKAPDYRIHNHTREEWIASVLEALPGAEELHHGWMKSKLVRVRWRGETLDHYYNDIQPLVFASRLCAKVEDKQSNSGAL